MIGNTVEDIMKKLEAAQTEAARTGVEPTLSLTFGECAIVSEALGMYIAHVFSAKKL